MKIRICLLIIITLLLVEDLYAGSGAYLTADYGTESLTLDENHYGLIYDSEEMNYVGLRPLFIYNNIGLEGDVKYLYSSESKDSFSIIDNYSVGAKVGFAFNTRDMDRFDYLFVYIGYTYFERKYQGKSSISGYNGRSELSFSGDSKKIGLRFLNTIADADYVVFFIKLGLEYTIYSPSTAIEKNASATNRIEFHGDAKGISWQFGFALGFRDLGLLFELTYMTSAYDISAEDCPAYCIDDQGTIENKSLFFSCSYVL